MSISKAWSWDTADKEGWLEPCEESRFYAEKWYKEGRRSVLDLGCGLGSLISDCISGYGFTYALIGAAQQILYGMVPWFLWNKINKEQDGNKFRLDCILRMLKFFLVMFVDAILIVILTGILINSFDSGLLFGCPLLIAGHGWKLHLSEIKTGIGTGRNGGH